ncbi:diacylglycerol/lipid kinase family protein [Xylophilus sp. GOD-11R]|uniref:diacylglycerol/lipid kinase family protein n=1 Tax=Xylophilus sp. GOD-11R TaxID=3089814 RepID=UPI00298D2371|nr:diacylglycerol kinase family protein [Xylophilus sp. GOD-11R]WPB57960.1 diacylglycerol kinase family protein [Xylophilus sp. GOD-11R]
MPTPPSPAADAPICLVYNARSGKGQAGDALTAVQLGCQAGGRALHAFPISRDKPPREQARAAVAMAQRVGGIAVVAGGDGTINAVAQAVLGSGCAFGVLPQGTFNYFGRNHGIPTETQPAVDLLLSQPPRPVQVGLVNDRVFLVNASMGLYATLLEEREHYKSRYGRSRWMALFAALATLTRRHRPWNLRLSWQGVQTEVQTSSLFVGNNALQFQHIGVEDGRAVEQGELAAVLIRPRGVLSQLGLVLNGFLRQLGRDDDVQTLSFRSLEVQPARGARRRSVKVAADGEIERMTLPLRFAVSDEPLWLIKPAEAS